MTTRRVTKSHTKNNTFSFYILRMWWESKKWVNAFCEILVSLVLWSGRISSVGLAQAFMVATLILSLRLRIADAGHLAVFHQNLSGGKAVPLQYVCMYVYMWTFTLIQNNKCWIYLNIYLNIHAHYIQRTFFTKNTIFFTRATHVYIYWKYM